jgi:inorganic pyrophosphatase
MGDQPLLRISLPLAVCAAVFPFVLVAHQDELPPGTLPAAATAALAASLDAATAHPKHVWRDTPALNSDGSVNAFVEIPRGERRKWEFDMKLNALALDRVIPEDLGGYPVNYGFVPQTVSYDGDPFDALVLGEPLPRGQLVRGVIVGLMLMEDEKGLDSKVVLARSTSGGDPRQALAERDRAAIAGFFMRYKQHEPGKFSRVPGWASPPAGRAHVATTHAFFLQCRERAHSPCDVSF